MISHHKIRAKVLSLKEQMGISNTKIGEILGGYSDNNKAKEARARKFFNGEKEITIDQLYNLADFFKKPIEYFLGTEKKSQNQTGTNQIQSNGSGNTNTINTGGTGDLINQLSAIKKTDPEKLKAILKLLED